MNGAETGREVVDQFRCPWCPLVVLMVDSEDAGRAYMEAHLDSHFAHAIGRPQARDHAGTSNVVGAA